MGLTELLMSGGRPRQGLTGAQGAPLRNSADLAMLRRKAMEAMQAGDFELADQYNAAIQQMAKQMQGQQEAMSPIGYSEGM